MQYFCNVSDNIPIIIGIIVPYKYSDRLLKSSDVFLIKKWH